MRYVFFFISQNIVINMNTNVHIDGFQFEPVRDPNDNDPVNYFSDGGDEIEMAVGKRRNLPISAWCQCGKCSIMPTEKECLCCQEIDAVTIFLSGGKEYYRNFVPRGKTSFLRS